ncbi:hypothetical protein CCACVL1_22400 [Corchorus capsularis]|uniref:Uncharacterized protein n=1 Tax=Corchorus capsularis TaxID=210143 RepID=A0A1R3GZR5_COCAP|nr:hypothetical protein CCACVL1_22400 [Corchorus capsularis]
MGIKGSKTNIPQPESSSIKPKIEYRT